MYLTSTKTVRTAWFQLTASSHVRCVLFFQSSSTMTPTRVALTLLGYPLSQLAKLPSLVYPPTDLCAVTENRYFPRGARFGPIHLGED